MSQHWFKVSDFETFFSSGTYWYTSWHFNRFVTADGRTRFCWSDSQQGLLKSGFFWGYLVLQIHGGTLAEKYGTRKVLGIALFISAILTLLTPLIAKWNIWALFVSRILIGIAEAVTYPSLPPLVQKWVPESEKSKFISFSYTEAALSSSTQIWCW